ncbi:hypothetical protein ABPG75_007585 [Micractinium tetrahymenae]
MTRLLHTPAGISDVSPAAAAKAMPAAPCSPIDPANAKAGPQSAADTGAEADAWTIGAAGAAGRHAEACPPPEHAPACMDVAVAPPEASCTALAAGPFIQAFSTLDLELTAEEAVCLVQALAPPAVDAIPTPRPAAAALQAARSLPRRLHRAATSLGAAGGRLARAASSGARRLRSTLAAAACLSPRASSAAAAEPFTPREGWTRMHVNWS